MTITDELRVIIEAEVERAVRDMDKWDDAVNETEKKLDALEKSADRMSNRLMLVSGGFAAVGGAGLKFAADIETQKIALEVLTGSAETAAKVFGEWQQFAAKTPLSMDDITGAGTQLLNFGTNVKDVTATLKTLGDVSMGNSGKLDTVVRAYGRMQMKGKATMEELNMLTEAGVPILDQLAKGMGVATDKIFDMAAKGKISFSDVQAALAALTGEGGKFHDMLERQSASLSGKLSTALDNLKISGAKLMETVVPMAKDLLDTISRVAENFQSLDEGTRKALVSLLAIGMAAGPIAKTGTAVIGVVKAISGFATMSPAVLGIAAVTAAVSALAGAFLLAKLNAKTFDESLASFKASQSAALSVAKSYDDMKATLPSLTKEMYDAAKATGNYAQAVADASKMQTLRDELSKLEKEVASKSGSMQDYLVSLKSTLEKPIDSNATSWVFAFSSGEEKIKTIVDNLNNLNGNIKRILNESSEFKSLFDARNFEGMLAFVQNIDGASPKIKERIAELKKEIEKIGSGTTISPKVALPPPASMKKTWQEWWEEVTKVDRKTFTTGAEAAKLYLEGLGSDLTYAESIGAALGEKINPIPYLEKQKEKINEDMIKLLSIKKGDILNNDEFNFGLQFDESGNAKIDASIKALIDRYKELKISIAQAESERKKLGEAEELSKRAAELVKSIETPLDRYKASLAEIDKIWKKQEYEGQLLNEEQLLKLTAAAAAEYREALKKIAKEQEAVKSASFDEWLESLTKEWLLHIGMTDKAAAAYAKLGTQLAMIAIDGLVDGFKELGQAWADGSLSAEDLGDAIGQVAKKILDQLPILFVQAGLQLIAQGQWALGLGFITGGFASAVIAGLTEGLTANANGNIFDSGAIVPFAQGGAFTNGIVNRATRFNIGEMGEKGAEAIVPLTRMPDGSLGVSSAGGEPVRQETNIYVRNYTGAQVQTRERTSGGVREIEMIVGAIVDRNLASGRHDGALGGRYGVSKRGIRG